MDKREHTMLILVLAAAGMLLLLLYSPWGSPDLYNNRVYFADNQGVNFESRIISKEYQYDVHKSLRHNDGELCFGGGWFIVVAVLPSGQISNHYKIEDWNLFQIPEVEKAKYEFDGHTSEDVINRMLTLIID